MNLLCSAKTNEICKSFGANLNHLTWSWLSLLENNPASLNQTAAVLESKASNDLNLFDAMQVKNFASGAEFLLNLVKEQKFELSLPLACNLHSRIGKNEALEWGCLRSAPVTLRNIKFCPPLLISSRSSTMVSATGKSAFPIRQKKQLQLFCLWLEISCSTIQTNEPHLY